MTAIQLPERDKLDIQRRLGELGHATTLTDADIGLLANLSYLPNNEVQGILRNLEGSGWQFIATRDDPNGYAGFAVYHENTAKLIIASRGTEPTQLNDLVQDIAGTIHVRGGQLDAALAFRQQVLDDLVRLDITPVEYDFTGHSLGGALSQIQFLAQYAYNQTSINPIPVHGVGIESAGFFGSIKSTLLSKNFNLTDAQYDDASLLYNAYFDRADLIPTAGGAVGGNFGTQIALNHSYSYDPVTGNLLQNTFLGAHNLELALASIRDGNLEGASNVEVVSANGKIYSVPKSLLSVTPASIVLTPELAVQMGLPSGFMSTTTTFIGNDGYYHAFGRNALGGYISIKFLMDGSGSPTLVAKETTQTYYNPKTGINTNIDYVRSDGNASGRIVLDQTTTMAGPGGTYQTVTTTAGTLAQLTANAAPFKVVQNIQYDSQGRVLSKSDDVFYHGYSLSGVGALFGTALSKALFHDELEGELGSVIFSAIGQNVLEGMGRLGIDHSAAEAFRSAFSNFGDDFRDMGVGAVSSYLSGELIQALGLQGTVAGELGQGAASQAFTHLITNIIQGQNPFQGITGINWATIAENYLGGKLGDLIRTPKSREGQIGASLGQTWGEIQALVTAASGGPVAFVAAVITIAIDRILGGIIGDMFSPGPPRSSVVVIWDGGTGAFVPTALRVDNRASPASAQALGTTIANFYNGVLAEVGGQLVRGEEVRAGTYGIDNTQYVYFGDLYGGTKLKSANISNVMAQGAYVGLTDIVKRLVGGNVYVKRALASHLKLSGAANFSTQALLGDLAIAQDYARYMSDPTTTNVLIATAPESSFLAGWAVTFSRAQELGLDKRAYTDWAGGWSMFLADVTGSITSLGGLQPGTAALTPGNLFVALDHDTRARAFSLFDTSGVLSATVGDTIDIAAKDQIIGTSGADTIDLRGGTNDTVQSTTGLTINGATASGSIFKVDVAAIIDAGGGDDTVYAGDLGNDVLGGAGNDILVGGKLDDWLFGGDGNDTLFAGQVSNTNPASTGGVTADEAAAVAVDGGNGNYLEGGAGDDRLYGGSGSDWLAGGDGNDRLVGGDGGDILDGGAGTDTEFGGQGSDQYLFGFGDGQDTIFDQGDPVTTDLLGSRFTTLRNNPSQANWAGGGNYEVNGDVVGGTDAIAFKAGIELGNLEFNKVNTNDLRISLLDGAGVLTGDVLTIQNWFLTQDRIEWLRFANGDEFRIGDGVDMSRFIFGGTGDDTLVGTNGNDFIWGGSGNDRVFALGGDDVAGGGLGDDVVSGDDGNDWVLGGGGDDSLYGGAGNDTVQGDGGDDFIMGGAGADILSGGKGNDTIVTGAGNDKIIFNRGDGQDRIVDDATNLWQVVYTSGAWASGWSNQSNGTITGPGGQIYFDGVKWYGRFYYDVMFQGGTLYRYTGNLATSAVNNGSDTLQFGVGIDIQDLEITAGAGADWVIGIAKDENSVASFDSLDDKITITNIAGQATPIETYVFAATGALDVTSYTVSAASQTDGNDIINLSTAAKAWVTAMNGDDVVTTGAGADLISGGGGNDTIYAKAGNDVIWGGAGNDTIDGGAGADQIFGGDGLDIASYADATAAVTVSLDGSVTATGDAAGDVFNSIEGLQGSNFADTLVGGSGDDLLIGGQGADTLKGGQGNDTYLYNSGDGADTIDDAGGAADVLSLGPGIGLKDITFARSTGQHLDLYLTIGGAKITIKNVTTTGVVETLQLADGLVANLGSVKISTSEASTSGDDLLIGGANADSLNGGAGNDVIFGGAGNDTLIGGAGNDILEGGAGADSFDGGTDDLTLGNAPVGANPYGDTIRYASSTAAVQVNLGARTFAGGDAAGDTVTVDGSGNATVENITGSMFGDTLTGDSRGNRLNGLDGNDIIHGAGGDDVISGGAGVDYLYGDDGADALSGGDGDDYLYGGLGNDILAGDAGNDVLYGDNDRTSAGGGNDTLSGGDGDDTLYGGSGDDTLTGDAGNDTLHGDDGNDILSGGDGNDTLYGNDGNDTLTGGAGNDSLNGGAGDDTYVFDAYSDADTVVDSAGINRVTISGVDNDRIWLTKSGNDLVVSVIGGTTVATIKDFYLGTSSATLMKSVQSSGHILFLKYAQGLIDQMTALGSTPAVMPQSISNLLASYWFIGDKAPPQVTETRLFGVDQGGALSDNVHAVDQDENITGYSVAADGAHGHVVILSDGSFTYTPNAGFYGEDRFVLKVTDADQQSATQTVTVEVQKVNLPPTAVTLSNTTVAERDHPVAGSQLPLVVIGALGVIDPDGPASPLVDLVYSVSDPRFTIVTNNGQPMLALQGGVALDYETTPTVTVEVTATDSSQNLVLRSEQLDALPWTATAGAASSTASGKGPDGAYSLDTVSASVGGGASLHGVTQTIGNAVYGSTYTLTLYARAIGSNHMLLVGDVGDQLPGGSGTQWSLASFDLSGDGSVRAKTNTVLSASVLNYGGDLYRVSITFQRSATGNFQILVGPDRASATVIHDTQNVVDGWVGAGETIQAGYVQLEAGTAPSGYTPTTDQPGVTHKTQILTLQVQDLPDYLYGTSGADTLTGAQGRDIIDGGAGDDILIGNGGNDSLTGDGGNDTLYGGDGDDVLDGGDGDDTLYGGAGADQLYGGAGNDLLSGGDGNDVLMGGDGDDVLQGGAGADQLVGGAGINTASYADSGAIGLTASLLNPTNNTGFAAGDTYSGIQNLELTAGADIGQGDNNANVIWGGDGNDTIYGEGGSDTIYGGAGNDIIYGDSYITNPETIGASDGDDTIYGGDGDDIIYGGGGADTIYGGAGNDTIYAGAGGDILDGGAGDDQLYGGSGSDKYRMDANSGHDTIHEFDETGEDTDVLGYAGLSNDNLWFQQSGNDLKIFVIGTGVITTVKDWFTYHAWGNSQIERLVTGANQTHAVNIRGLVTLMAGLPMPTSVAAFGTLLASDANFKHQWDNYWDANHAPVLQAIADQTMDEDSGNTNTAFDVTYHVTDDGPMGELSVVGYSPNATVTVGQPDANGTGVLHITPTRNWSGQTTVTWTVTDGGGAGLPSSQTFNLTVNPKADIPTLTTIAAVTGTLDTGLLSITPDGVNFSPVTISIPASLNDTDGSETLEVRISGFLAAYTAGLRFNRGSWNAGGSYWSLLVNPTQNDLIGLGLTGPSTWTTDLSLGVTAYATDTASGLPTSVAQSATQPLTIVIDGRPAPISFGGNPMQFPEDQGLNTPWATGTKTVTLGGVTYNLPQFTSNDPDLPEGSDHLHWFVSDNIGGAFGIDATTGQLFVQSGQYLDYENNPSPQITVTVRDDSNLTRSLTTTINLVNVHDIAPTLSIQPGTYTRYFNETTNDGTSYSAFSGQLVATLAPSIEAGLGLGVNYQFLYGSDYGIFQIAGNNLILKPGATFDFDQHVRGGDAAADYNGLGRYQDRRTVYVQATDTGGLSSNVLALTVDFADVNERPVITGGWYINQSVPWWANGAAPYTVYGVSWYEPDVEWANQVDLTYGFSTNSGYFGFAGSAWGSSDGINYSGPVNYQGPKALNAWVGTNVYITDRGGLGNEVDSIWAFSGLPPAPTINFWNTYSVDQGGVYYQDWWYINFNATANSDASAYVQTDNYWDASSNVPNNYPSIGQSGSSLTFWHDTNWWYLDSNWEYQSGEYYAAYTVQISAHDTGYPVSSTGIFRVQLGDSSYRIAPIVFGLGDDPAPVSAIVQFKASADADLARYTWITPNQAFLFLDRNGDGVVNDGSEISFIQDKLGAQSDLEGLAVYDTNGDGVFDAQDARFGEFKIWQDANTDGVSTPDEIRTLDQAGIASINLTGAHMASETTGAQTVHAGTTFTRSDGTIGMALDAFLVGPPTVEQIAAWTSSDILGNNAAPTPGSSLLVLDSATGPAQRSQAPQGLQVAPVAQSVVVVDWNRDGQVNDLSEANFLSVLPNAPTPSTSLTVFDLNKDGVLDQADAGFKYFGVWTDANGDGVSDPGEFKSFADLGIQSVDLSNPDSTDILFTWADGSVGLASAMTAGTAGVNLQSLPSTQAVAAPQTTDATTVGQATASPAPTTAPTSGPAATPSSESPGTSGANAALAALAAAPTQLSPQTQPTPAIAGPNVSDDDGSALAPPAWEPGDAGRSMGNTPQADPHATPVIIRPADEWTPEVTFDRSPQNAVPAQPNDAPESAAAAGRSSSDPSILVEGNPAPAGTASPLDAAEADIADGYDLAAFAAGPSAVDAGLALTMQMRLQMASAMAGFTGDSGALLDDQGLRLKDPAAMALLTQLPDYRVVQPAASMYG